jgi:hypothetical protein
MKKVVFGCVALLIVVHAVSAAVIDDDFETDTGAWSTADGMSRALDFGGTNYGFGTLDNGGTGYFQSSSMNSTAVPPGQKTIELDLYIASVEGPGNTRNLAVAFNMTSTVAGRVNTDRVWLDDYYQVSVNHGFAASTVGHLILSRIDCDEGAGTATVTVLDKMALGAVWAEDSWMHLTISDDGAGGLSALLETSQGNFTVSATDNTYHGAYVGLDQYGCRGQYDNIVVTPEPATMGLLGLGSLGMAILRLRRSRR